MKKLLIIIFAALICSVTVNSQTWDIGSPIASAVTATLSDSTLTITGTGAMMNFSGSRPWELSKASITTISIGNSVTSIGQDAFSGCSSIKSITIPDSVTSIGTRAFSNCIALTSVTLPGSIASIGHSAFFGCSSLISVVIPPSVTSIGHTAFSGCSALTAINVDAANTAYSSVDGILYTKDTIRLIQCPLALISVIIPNSVITIDNNAFEACSSLTSVIIPASVKNIWSSAFSLCSKLTTITLPDSIRSIGGRAFYGCSKLTAITIPDSVTYIGSSSFSNCIGLTSITIPEGVTYVNMHAFSGCTNLATVNFNAINCNTMGSFDYPVFLDCSSLNIINIGNEVTTIPNSAFRGCKSLTSITIPASVKSIGGSAFSSCSTLVKINNQRKTPQTITTSAFEGVNKQTCVLLVPVGSVSAYKSSTGWKDFLKIFDDATAPNAPGGLMAANTSSTSIALTWTASTDNVGVTNYNIYLDGALQGTSAGTTFTFTDLTPATSYLIEVEAVDSAGNISSKVSLSKNTSGIAISSVGENTIKVYPNPAKDFIIIKNDENKNINIQILDMSGQMLIEKNINGEQMDIQSLLPGIYIIKVDGSLFELIKQ